MEYHVVTSEDGVTKWHGGKGSGRRSTADDDSYRDNWDRIFGKKKPVVKSRKKTPTHGVTQVHVDKTKYNRKKVKDETI